MSGVTMRRPAIALAIIALGFSAQAAGLPHNLVSCPASAKPGIVVSAAGEAHLDISVMLYNVEGLPFPARMNREPDLARIADALAVLRAACNAPQIIVVQEAFSATAASIGRRAGYPYIASGPGADAVRQSGAAALPAGFLAGRRFAAGERAPKLINGGLQVLSVFPMAGIRAEPYSATACAGTDCLANKGAMLVQLQIPGLPAPVDLLNTHMNSRKGAGVPFARTDTAHKAQTQELAGFLSRHRTRGNPLLVAADFNMRAAPERFAHFERHMPHTLVHRACNAAPCAVGFQFETAAPWLETQDLQAFEDGSTVRIRPLRLTAHFDGKHSPMLSDHIATIVTYRLSWQQAQRVG